MFMCPYTNTWLCDVYDVDLVEGEFFFCTIKDYPVLLKS